MKSRKCLLFLLLFFLSGKIHTQDFTIFPEESASWDVVEKYYTDGPIANEDISRYELLGDTVINDLKYSKIYITWSAGFLRDGPCSFIYYSQPIKQSTYFGAIRSDSLQKVYFIIQETTEEKKIYDFSADSGEVILLEGFEGSYNAKITQVDSILIQNEYHKRVTVDVNNQDVWIEGIGSKYGLLTTYFGTDIGTTTELICFRRNNTMVYITDGLDCNWCDIVTDKDKINLHKIDENISFVNPNPVISKSAIDIPLGLCSGAIVIYDLAGRIIYNANISDERSHNIYKEDLKVGMFIIEVKTKQILYRQRIIVL